MSADLIAAGIYFCTMLLGLVARRLSRSFGTWHHVMYGLCCIALVTAIVLKPSVLHVAPVAALIMLPLTRPRVSRTHDMVAIFGALGFAMLLRM